LILWAVPNYCGVVLILQVHKGFLLRVLKGARSARTLNYLSPLLLFMRLSKHVRMCPNFVSFPHVLGPFVFDRLGSAVAVERIFSGGRDIIFLRRAGLKPGTIRVLMLDSEV
jgi:hypothetical protein